MIKHPKYPRGNIYLSGGMQFAKELGAAWRQNCGERLKQMEYFPLDIAELDRAYSAEHGELYHLLDTEKHLQYKSNFRKHFIYTDLQLVQRDSDALIVYYDESARRGAGTISECQYAYNHDIPIFLLSHYPRWEKEVPGWLQGLTTRIFTTFEDLYLYLDKLPYGILKRDAYGNHHAGPHYLCSLCGNVFEKSKHHFVSKISPLYCKPCVSLVNNTYEAHKDRYEFIVERLEVEALQEIIQQEKR